MPEIDLYFKFCLFGILVYSELSDKCALAAPLHNHIKLGVSLRVLYCVVDTGYGLGRSLGDCRPVLSKVPNG